MLTVLRARRLIAGTQMNTEAAKLGMSAASLYNVENKRIPRDKINPSWVEAIEGAHGLPLDDLLKELTL